MGRMQRLLCIFAIALTTLLLQSPTVAQNSEALPSESISENDRTPGTRVSGISPGYLIAAVAGLLVTAVLSLILAYHHVRWRKILDGGTTAIVPNDLLSEFSKIEAALRSEAAQSGHLTNAIGKSLSDDAERYSRLTALLSQIQESLAVFRASLDTKDAEIDRLRKGADAAVLLNFMTRFLRVHATIGAEIQRLSSNSQDTRTLLLFQESLEDALSECGVDKFWPREGESLRSAFGIAPNPTVVETQDKDLHLTIASVVQPGFLLRAADQPICLQEATVTVNKYVATGETS